MLVTNILIFKDNATSGPNQMALLVSAVITVGLGKFKLKIPYDDMEKQMIISIKLALQACLILLLVGSLIGIWILSGIVPTMIYYGLELINPNWFLPVACISCSLVA
jgi:NhaC family Na+:H+ antiporter